MCYRGRVVFCRSQEQVQKMERNSKQLPLPWLDRVKESLIFTSNRSRLVQRNQNIHFFHGSTKFLQIHSLSTTTTKVLISDWEFVILVVRMNESNLHLSRQLRIKMGRLQK